MIGTGAYCSSALWLNTCCTYPICTLTYSCWPMAKAGGSTHDRLVLESSVTLAHHVLYQLVVPSLTLSGCVALSYRPKPWPDTVMVSPPLQPLVKLPVEVAQPDTPVTASWPHELTALATVLEVTLLQPTCTDSGWYRSASATSGSQQYTVASLMKRTEEQL